MPIYDLSSRICSHCGGTKWYVIITSFNTPSYRCVSKAREDNKLFLAKNKEKVFKRKKKWAKNNRDKYNKWQKTYAEKHKDKIRLRTKLYRKIIREELKDSYIINLLTGNSSKIKHKEIPQELIEIKRKQIKLYKNVKQKENNGNIGHSGS